MSIDLTGKIIESIKTCILTNENIGIAYSGGIDSLFLAKISSDIYKKKVILLSIGFPCSHDLEFSRRIARELNMKHITYEIRNEEFTKIVRKAIDNLECNNISHIENCIAFYFKSFLSISYA